MQHFDIEVREVGATWRLVEVYGEVDVHSASDLRRELLRLVDEGATSLVVDLAGATFVDSFILGVLVGVLKRVRTVWGEMLVVCPDPGCRRIFELTLLDRLFPIYDSRQAAMAAARSSGALQARDLPG